MNVLRSPIGLPLAQTLQKKLSKGTHETSRGYRETMPMTVDDDEVFKTIRKGHPPAPNCGDPEKITKCIAMSDWFAALADRAEEIGDERERKRCRWFSERWREIT